MKGFLFFLVFISSFSYVSSSFAKVKDNKLQEIVELFINNSQDSALQLLKSNEQALLDSLVESTDSDSYFLFGKAYFYAEMDGKSEGMFKAALSYNDKLPNAHYYIGLINMFAGDFFIAEASFEKAIALDDSNDAYLFELARIQERLGKIEEASSQYEKALNINASNYNASINLANIHIGKKKKSKAEALYISALKIKPDNLILNYNIGQLYQDAGKHDLAIKHFSKVVELDNFDWRAVAKIIQENQALGNKLERDNFISNIYTLWTSNKIDDLVKQGFFIREQGDIAKGKLYVLEYFELAGERARKFVFKIQDPQTSESIIDISLGSYDLTTAISRETGNIGPDERIYHLDGYLPNGSHYTYAFFDEQPNYDDVREMVFDVLSGKQKAVSSTVFSNENKPIKSD